MSGRRAFKGPGGAGKRRQKRAAAACGGWQARGGGPGREDGWANGRSSMGPIWPARTTAPGRSPPIWRSPQETAAGCGRSAGGSPSCLRTGHRQRRGHGRGSPLLAGEGQQVIGGGGISKLLPAGATQRASDRGRPAREGGWRDITHKLASGCTCRKSRPRHRLQRLKNVLLAAGDRYSTCWGSRSPSGARATSWPGWPSGASTSCARRSILKLGRLPSEASSTAVARGDHPHSGDERRRQYRADLQQT